MLNSEKKIRRRQHSLKQDQLKEENLQLKAVYDQLLLDSQADQQALGELQASEEELRKELETVREVAELERYRGRERSGKIVKSGYFNR